ncbi:MAG: hypothetical protein ACLPTZ_20865 [Beijerinckiaceae bacterium]
MGHSRPSRLPRNATYDRSCLKADIRRPPTGLVLEIEIRERLPGAVAGNEARVVRLIDPDDMYDWRLADDIAGLADAA